MKQTIEEAARQHRINANNDHYNWKREEEAFIAGATSPEAKDFHTQGMYSEEELETIACNFFSHHLWNDNASPDHITVCFNKWFEDYKKKKVQK